MMDFNPYLISLIRNNIYGFPGNAMPCLCLSLFGNHLLYLFRKLLGIYR